MEKLSSKDGKLNYKVQVTHEKDDGGMSIDFLFQMTDHMKADEKKCNMVAEWLWRKLKTLSGISKKIAIDRCLPSRVIEECQKMTDLEKKQIILMIQYFNGAKGLGKFFSKIFGHS